MDQLSNIYSHFKSTFDLYIFSNSLDIYRVFSPTSSTGAHGIESLQTEFISSFDALIILNFHLFHGIVGVDFFVLKLMVHNIQEPLIICS